MFLPRVRFPEHPKSIQEQEQSQRKSDKAGLEAEHGNQCRENNPGDYRVGFGWRSYRNVTFSQLVEEFGIAKAAWENSPECKAMVLQLESLKGAARSKITNIVALGIGSLHDTRSRNSSSTRRSALQLAAVLTIASYLGGKSGLLSNYCQLRRNANARWPCSAAEESLPVLAQDPDYSELEKDFLRSLDITVAEDPDAFSSINPGSLVFHIGTYFDLAWWISAGSWPAAMICNDWGNPRPELCNHMAPFCRQRVHYMFQHYHETPFLDIDHRSRDWERVNLYCQR